MKAWPSTIKAVIFDSDGVLVDTIPIYAMANTEVMGMPYPDSFQLTANGLCEIEFANRLVNEFKLNMTAEEFVKRRHKILLEHLSDVDLVPGIEAIVRKVHSMGIPMAVATSADRISHDIKTVNHKEFFGLFMKQICGDEVKKAKPNPEIFQTAGKYLGDFKPEEYLVFEDSINGICAANAAGMASVFLSNGEDVKSTLEEKHAKPSVIVSSFKDFDFNVFNWANQS